MRRGIAFLLIVALLMGAFAAMGENGTEQTNGAHAGEGGAETAQQTSEAESGSVASVPFGDRYTLETEVRADGFPRREAGTEPFETLSFTLKIDAHKGPDYFRSEYAASYKLNGSEAVVQFEITLNDYSGDLEIIPQNALDIVLMSEAGGSINGGYQLMDAEIAGKASVSVAPNVAATLYKRYDYDPAVGPMRYLQVIAHVGGEQIPALFDIGPVTGWCLMVGSEGEEVARLQRALISKGLLQGIPDGKFGLYTADAVKIMQGRYGLAETGIADWAFLSRLYEDCDMEIIHNEVWEELGVPEGSIGSSDPEKITKLDLSGSSIRSLDALNEFPNLTELDLSICGVSDLSGLSGLTKLTALSLNGNGISDLSGLSGLTNLTTLSLNGNGISDLSGIGGLTNLTALSLDRNKISGLSGLSGLTNLTTLSLNGNGISDLSGIGGLTNLTALSLDGNAISDLSGLSGLTNLTKLSLVGNKISDITGLSGLTNLEDLALRDNRIGDIGALSGLTNLKDLYLDDNMIRDISALSGLTNLEDLDLGDNMIRDISALSGLTNLKDLDLDDNKSSDIGALSGLTKLERLYFCDNKVSDFSALCGLANLSEFYYYIETMNDISYIEYLRSEQ